MWVKAGATLKLKSHQRPPVRVVGEGDVHPVIVRREANQRVIEAELFGGGAGNDHGGVIAIMIGTILGGLRRWGKKHKPFYR